MERIWLYRPGVEKKDRPPRLAGPIWTPVTLLRPTADLVGSAIAEPSTPCVESAISVVPLAGRPALVIDEAFLEFHYLAWRVESVGRWPRATPGEIRGLKIARSAIEDHACGEFGGLIVYRRADEAFGGGAELSGCPGGGATGYCHSHNAYHKPKRHAHHAYLLRHSPCHGRSRWQMTCHVPQ